MSMFYINLIAYFDFLLNVIVFCQRKHGLFSSFWMMNGFKNKTKDTQKTPQSQSTAFPKHQKNER